MKVRQDKRKKKVARSSSSGDLLDLSSIYKDCVKLGTMNVSFNQFSVPPWKFTLYFKFQKINQKNAWSLQLLDYIDTVLDVEEKQSAKNNNHSQKNKPRDQTESDPKSITNFQFASNTLDASVKIYACRVDNVHNETYKVLGGLERSDKDKQKEKQNQNESDDEETGTTTESATRKIKKRVNHNSI